jgi:hypothetical protein
MPLLNNCNRSGLVICYNCNFQEMGRVIVVCRDVTYRMVCCPKVRKYQEAFVERNPNQHQYSFHYFVVGILKYCIKSVITECLVYGPLNHKFVLWPEHCSLSVPAVGLPPPLPPLFGCKGCMFNGAAFSCSCNKCKLRGTSEVHGWMNLSLLHVVTIVVYGCIFQGLHL